MDIAKESNASGCIVYELFSSFKVVQTNNRKKSITLVMLYFSALHFRLAVGKQDAVPRLLLTNESIDYCHLTCGAAFLS